MQVKKYDAIIVGSGQAGTPLAFKMAGEGEKVAFIEKEHWGGTCVNVGCTPTKAYVASARRMWDAHHGDALGVSIHPGTKINLPKVKERKDALIRKSSEGIASGIKSSDNISSFKGEASFTGFKTLEVNGEQIQAEQIFINTGARPFIPDGFEDVEISKSILEILQEEGVEFRLNATCISGKNNKDGTVTVSVDCTKGAPDITPTDLLLAVGRKPNTDMLNLQATGLSADKRGYLEVNDYLETSVAGIYAIARAKEKGETKGLMNAIIDADTKEFLGAAVLGVGGDEIISSILTLMYAKAPYTVFRDAVIPHPTITELIPTMLESAREINKS